MIGLLISRGCGGFMSDEKSTKKEIWLPWRTRQELHAQRQSSEIWSLDDDFDAVGSYLSAQRLTSMYGGRGVKEARDVEMGRDSSLFQSSLWTDTDGVQPWDLSSGERSILQKQCHKLYFLNPFAGNIIDNYAFYTLGGEGLSVEWTNENTALWWEMLAKRNRWIWFSKDAVLLTYITGECFAVLFPQTNPKEEIQKEKLDLVEIHPTDISQVKTSDNDRRVIEGYVRQSTSGHDILTYLPEDVVHFKIRDVGGVPRGRPILERVLRPLALFDDWLGSRADLNRMRARLPVIRYRAGLKRAAFPIRSLPEPGTVIDAHEGVERWEFPSFNIQAADAGQDGLELKLYIAAGVNLPAYMVTGEGSTAEIIGSTPLMLFESMQGLFRGFFEELFQKMMPTQFKAEKPVLIFPEVDLRDFDRKSRSVMEEFTSGLRSRHSAQIALGLKPDEEEAWMKQELGLSESEVDEIPEAMLRKIVNSVIFHAPAVNNGKMTNEFLTKLTDIFDKRGWT